MRTMARKRKQPEPPANPWPARLRALRQKLGLASQQQAATRFRVSLRTWAAWESGETTPPRVTQLLFEMLEGGAALPPP
jgi:DNA-binding transcriptional regulator YiaG